MINENLIEQIIHPMTNEIIDQLGSDAAKELAQDIIKTCQNNVNVVDGYSDDELFVANLKMKYPDYTVDELIDKLSTAKVNKDFYRKEVLRLRKNIEDSIYKKETNKQRIKMMIFNRHLEIYRKNKSIDDLIKHNKSNLGLIFINL